MNPPPEGWKPSKSGQTWEQEVAWTHQMFHTLAPGGTWAIPAVGLITRRTGEHTITLEAMMPWAKGMPMSPLQLLNAQNEMWAQVSLRLNAAGIEAERSC